MAVETFFSFFDIFISDISFFKQNVSKTPLLLHLFTFLSYFYSLAFCAKNPSKNAQKKQTVAPKPQSAKYSFVHRSTKESVYYFFFSFLLGKSKRHKLYKLFTGYLAYRSLVYDLCIAVVCGDLGDRTDI